MDEILRYCESHRDWLMETTVALARAESPTADKVAADRCGQELTRRLEALGASVETIPVTSAGNHLRATLGDGSRQILLLGHYDTVWPVGQTARMPIRQEDGRLHGPGVFDMKAGIAIGMLAWRALEAQGHLPSTRVVMLWTSDEERGSGTSRPLVEAEAQRSEAVLVLEPALPGGALKTARKGTGEFELRIQGIPAHAGLEPEKGVSAIGELVTQILHLETLGDPARGTSVNVGIVEGGSRPNVVAEHARAVIDARASTLRDAETLTDAITTLQPRRAGTTLHVTGGFSRPPLERSPGVVRLLTLAQAIARELGRELEEGTSGGGSDGNLTAALGVPTLDGLGAVGDGAHALHEHVDVETLPFRAALVAGLIARLGSA